MKITVFRAMLPPRMGKDNKKKGAAHERARRVLRSSHPVVQYRNEYSTADDNTSLNNSFARSFERAKFTRAQVEKHVLKR